MAAPILKNLVDQIQFTSRTNQRGYISEKDMNALIDGAQQSLQNYLVGLQQPQGGNKFPVVTDQGTSDVSELLLPFKLREDAVLAGNDWVFVAGNIPLFIKVDNYYAEKTGVLVSQRIRFPNDGRVNTFRDSKIRQPSTNNFIGEWFGPNQLRVFPVPDLVSKVGIERVPPTNVVYGDNFTIDEDLSTELRWGQRAIPYLKYYALKEYGISIASPFLTQAAATSQSASI